MTAMLVAVWVTSEIRAASSVASWGCVCCARLQCHLHYLLFSIFCAQLGTYVLSFRGCHTQGRGTGPGTLARHGLQGSGVAAPLKHLMEMLARGKHLSK